MLETLSLGDPCRFWPQDGWVDFLDLGRRAQLPFDQAEHEERSVEMAVPSLDLENDFRVYIIYYASHVFFGLS